MLVKSLRHLTSKAVTSLLSLQFNALRLSSSALDPKPPVNPTLTQEEINKINLLIPRLCLSDNLPTAIRLVSAALTLNPPPRSLSLHVLTLSLSSQADMTQPMALLNRLKHTPPTHSYLSHITALLMADYFKCRKCKEAVKVYQWMLRPDVPCKPEGKNYGILVNGLCRYGFVFEGLKVLKAMVEAGFLPGSELRVRVYRSLLREAKVVQAKELDKALGSALGGADKDEDVRKVSELLDCMLRNWTE